MPRAIFDRHPRFIDWIRQDDIDNGFILDDENNGWFIVNIAIDAPEIPVNDRRFAIDNHLEDLDLFAPIEVQVPDHLVAPAAQNAPMPWHAAPIGDLAAAPHAGIVNVANTLENGPSLWEFVLGNVTEIYGCDAAIAGGAIRDHFLGIPPKDIDVFIDHAFREVVMENMPELNFGGANDLTNSEYQQKDDKIVGVWEFHGVKGHVINLIARPIPEKDYVKPLLDTFDFNICKSAFYIHPERGPELYDSEVAMADRGLRTFTYVGENDDLKMLASKKRFEKFVQRTGLTDFKLEMHDMKELLQRKKEADEKRKAELEALGGYTSYNTGYKLYKVRVVNDEINIR